MENPLINWKGVGVDGLSLSESDRTSPIEAKFWSRVLLFRGSNGLGVGRLMGVISPV